MPSSEEIIAGLQSIADSGAIDKWMIDEDREILQAAIAALESQPAMTPERATDNSTQAFLDRAREMAMPSHIALREERTDPREQIESLRVAMLGTEDGGFLDPDNEIPAGEMFRLASEWLIAAGYAKSPQVEGVVETIEGLDALPLGTLFAATTEYPVAWEVVSEVTDGTEIRYTSTGLVEYFQSKTLATLLPVKILYTPRTVTPWKPEETA